MSKDQDKRLQEVHDVDVKDREQERIRRGIEVLVSVVKLGGTCKMGDTDGSNPVLSAEVEAEANKKLKELIPLLKA